MILRRNINRTWFVLTILLLCFCVVMQMLGVPVTLWNPSVTDTSGENLGFSITPTIPQLTEPILVATVEISRQYLHIFPPLYTVFHPPKSPQ
jgi:hypothetical protein